MSADTIAAVKAAAADRPDEVLAAGIRVLDRQIAAYGQKAGPERLVRAALCDLLEERHPEVTPAIAAWLDGPSDGRAYADALLGELGL